MAQAMRMRVSLQGEVADVKVLMSHPMETGLREDAATGKVIPMHFIKTVSATHNGKPVLQAQWSQAVSRNPFLHFRLRGVKRGDKVGIAWEDDRGATGSTETEVQ
jgi:sulfur-oxidizing protein SoxZ